MRFCLAILAVALMASWAHIRPAAAQCGPTECSGDVLHAKAKHSHAKHAKAKKPHAPKEEYLRIAP